MRSSIRASTSKKRRSITGYIGKHFQDLRFSAVKDAPQVGDVSTALILKKGDTVNYIFGFSYRNYVHLMQFSGLESEVTPEFAAGIAGLLLDKMKAAPLSSP